MKKVRITAAFAASAALVAVTAGTASAASGGNPASAVPAGCSFSQGISTCSTTTSTPGTTTVTIVPSTFKTTSGPAYDLEYAMNIHDCTPGAPIVRGSDTTTTTPSSVTTTTTAHQGAPGSQGEQLPTQTSTVPGPVTTTTSTTQPASPGTVTIAGTTATTVFTGLRPNTEYGLGVRCLGNVVDFWTDGAGAASAPLDLSRFAGQQIQLELFAAPNDWFGTGYAVTAPLTPLAP
jgi:hypothetical protein